MKLLVVLALIPLALGAVPVEKRFFFDSVDTAALSSLVHSLVAQLGTDSTEAACEAACHGLIQGGDGALGHTFCTPICRSLQTLAAQFGATGKRALFGSLGSLLNLDGLSTLVNDIVHLVGADATEQACEGACHSIVLGDENALLHTFCSPICHSLQALAQHFDHTPTEATIGKRNFLGDLLNLGGLSTLVNDIVHLVGADATEQACEGACHSIVLGGEGALLHTFCSPICHSLQTLAQYFDHTPTEAPIGKRQLFANLLNLNGLSTLVNDIVHLVGADATEQACEGACHSIVLGGEGALLHTFCSPICHSLQTLVQHFDHTPTDAPVAKRNFFSSLIDTAALTNGLQQLLDFVGTDASEEVCELGCHRVILGDETSLFHTFCTPICRSLQTLVHTFHLAPAATAAP